MAFLTHFFGVILTLCILVLVTVPAPPPPPPPPSPGGYRMAYFWPPGFCFTLGDDCLKGEVSEDTFTAHGLWPSNANGGSMKSRRGKNSWQSSFTSIKDGQAAKLAPYWKNYNKSIPGGARTVWRYEWDKHGENGHFSQYDYFDRVADLTKEYGKRLVQILAEERITPKRIEEGGYQVAHIEKALFKGLENIKPEVVCKNDDKAPSIVVLKEIRLILDSAAKQLRNATSQKCKEQRIYFPPTGSYLSDYIFRHTEL